jgi:hypothetical protein
MNLADLDPITHKIIINLMVNNEGVCLLEQAF